MTKTDLAHSPFATCAALATGQHGVFSTSQALERGMSPSALQRAVAAGRLHRVRRSTYRLPGAPRTFYQDVMEACLAAGGDAVASFVCAGALHGFPHCRRGHIEISCSGRPRGVANDVIVHRTKPLLRMEVTTAWGIPATSPVENAARRCRRPR